MGTSVGIHMITGGAWSGKTDHATRVARTSAQQVTWIGTGLWSHPDFKSHIEALKSKRPREWETLDRPVELIPALQELKKQKSTPILVIDSLSQWLVNLVVVHSSKYDQTQLTGFIHQEIQELSEILSSLKQEKHIIVVSGDFSHSLPPTDFHNQVIRRLTGDLNRKVADIASTFEYLSCGIVIAKKEQKT